MRIDLTFGSQLFLIVSCPCGVCYRNQSDKIWGETQEYEGFLFPLPHAQTTVSRLAAAFAIDTRILREQEAIAIDKILEDLNFGMSVDREKLGNSTLNWFHVVIHGNCQFRDCVEIPMVRGVVTF